MYPSAPPNMLTTAGNMINVSSAMQENQLLKQKVEAQNALGGILQNVPKDSFGNPDYDAAAQQGSQLGGMLGPAVAAAALALKKQSADAALALTQKSSADLEFNKNKYQGMADLLDPISQDLQKQLANPQQYGTPDPDVYRKRVSGAVAEMINLTKDANGVPSLTPQAATTMLTQHIEPLLTPQGLPMLKDMLVNQKTSALQMAGQYDAALKYKNGEQVNLMQGNQPVPALQSVVTRQYTPIDMNPTPPAGQQGSVNTSHASQGGPAATVSATAQGTGVTTPSMFGYTPPESNAQGTAASQGSGGSSNPQEGYNSKGVPAVTIHPSSQAAPAGAAPTAPLRVGLAQGEAENIANYNEKFDDDIDAANEAKKNIAPLEGVLKLANSAGPNEEMVNALRARLSDTFFSDNPVIKEMFPDGVQKATDYEILSKFAAQAQGLGMSQNARNQLESVVQAKGSPSPTQLPGAIRAIGQYLLGQATATASRGDYVEPLKGANVDAGTASRADAAWRDNYDQNAFEWKYLNADEKKNLLGSMSPQQKEDFKEHVGFLVDHSLATHKDYK